MPEPVDADPKAIAKVVVRNSCQVLTALAFLRHMASIGWDFEPEGTWPEIRRNVKIHSRENVK